MDVKEIVSDFINTDFPLSDEDQPGEYNILRCTAVTPEIAFNNRDNMCLLGKGDTAVVQQVSPNYEQHRIR